MDEPDEMEEVNMGLRNTIDAQAAHINALEAELSTLREAVRNLGGDPDQAWFWTDEWQAKEREAQEDIDAGRVEDAGDFLAGSE